MLAPMQGITNRALRRLFVEWVRPDVVFTEFIRVRPKSKKGLSATDREEVSAAAGGVPVVAQLIGSDERVLLSRAREIEDVGIRHINLNLGCPAGRMTPGAAGGGLLAAPQVLPHLLRALRKGIHGTFSVKVRAGYDDPRQILSLLPVFEEEGVDFLVLHPRTVKQGYAGDPDHGVTAEVVAGTRLPVIANGDVLTAGQGREVLARTGSSGLMLGRGAISDPLLFLRMRGRAADVPTPVARRQELAAYVGALAERYGEIFCGEAQVLYKLKEVFRHVRGVEPSAVTTDLKRVRTLRELREYLTVLGGQPPPSVDRENEPEHRDDVERQDLPRTNPCGASRRGG